MMKYYISNAGAISDYIVGKIELAKYFLSILNLSDEYKKWEKFSASGSIYNESAASQNSHLEKRRMRQSDHTQVMLLFYLDVLCR